MRPEAIFFVTPQPPTDEKVFRDKMKILEEIENF